MIIIAKGKFSQPRKPKQYSELLDDVYDVPEKTAAPIPAVPHDSSMDETMVLSDDYLDLGHPVIPAAPPVTIPAREEMTFEEEIFMEETADDPEDEYDYDDEPAPKPRKKKRKKNTTRVVLLVSLILVVTLLIGAIAAAGMLYVNSNKDDGLILNNVTVAGVNIGGMTPEEAAAAIHRATDLTFTTENMVIYLPDTILELSPADTKAQLDVNAAVEAAFNYGRAGTAEENKQALADSLISNHTIALLPYLKLDLDYIRSQLDAYGAYFNSDYEDSSWELEGERPELEGDKFDEQAIPQTLILRPGKPGRYVDINKVYNDVLDAYSMNLFEVRTDMTDEEQMPETIDLKAIFEEICTESVDASMDMDTFEVTMEVYGYTFDLEKAQELLSQTEYGSTTAIALEYIVPEVLSADLTEKLFRDELAYCETPHTDDSNRNTNLKLACAAINNYILMPGDTFDYNKVLGERTEEKGYKPAGALNAGTSTTEVGGGICQVSSTLYYCTLLADLEIRERRSHSLPSSYMPMKGVDATVSWGGPNFRFRNNTDYPIRIEAEVSGNKVKVKLIGTDDKDYYIKMESKTVEVLKPKVVEEVYSAAEAAAKGYKDGQIKEPGVTGFTVYSYKCKYSKETDKLISKDFEATSNYVCKDQIVIRVEPEVTEPPTTEAPTTPPADDPTTAPTEPPETNPPATEPPADPTDPPAQPDPPAEGDGEETT